MGHHLQFLPKVGGDLDVATSELAVVGAGGSLILTYIKMSKNDIHIT